MMKKEYTSPQLELEELEANGVFTSGDEADNPTKPGSLFNPFEGMNVNENI